MIIQTQKPYNFFTFSTRTRSPTRRVGYIEDEGIKRNSQKVDHKRKITRSLNKSSKPGHERKAKLWQGIQRKEGYAMLTNLYKAEGLKKLMVESGQLINHISTDQK